MLPVELAHTLAGAVIVAAGAGVMVAVWEPEAAQPPAAVTVTLRVVVPVAPAVKVIAGVFAALVIVPFVIVQT